MSNPELAAHFFLQLAVILVACRVAGALAARLGQPQVIGEMIVGIVLGPSVFGLLLPAVQAAAFPKATMGVLYVASQLGLMLYMFLVGAEFRLGLLRLLVRSAVAVSGAGIALPFALGGGLAVALVGRPGFFGAGVSGLEAALFMGAAMSITAFPVLARIIEERGLASTPLGALALASASIDDAVAWCVLALVLAISNGNPAAAGYAAVGGLAYAAAVTLIVRPALARLARRAGWERGLGASAFSLLLIILTLGALFTERIGIHAVFGAFVFGLAVPRGAVAAEVRQRLEAATRGLLLPLFFVFSGLNTRVGLLDTPSLWAVALAVLLAASAGKVIGCGLAALWSGRALRDAAGIGALMNARGLVELIVLNVGLERGLITPQLFTVMVLMAVATTVLATPLFELTRARFQPREPGLGPPTSAA